MKHIAILHAPADRAVALALWRELCERGLAASLHQGVFGEGAATHLVVLCSPAASESLDLSQAARVFLDHAPRHRIITVPVDSERPVLPPVLQASRAESGLLEPASPPPATGPLYDSPERVGAVAAEIRALVGGAVSSPRDSLLWRRIREPLLAALGVAAIGLGLWGADASRRLDAARSEAADAERFADVLLGEITEQLPNAAREDVLAAIAEETLAALGQASLSELDDDALARRAGLFHFIGEARDVHGDPDGATEAFRLAHEITGALLERAPGDVDRIFDHAQSAFWLANSAYRQGDLATARRGYADYQALTERLVEREPDNQLYRAERAHAAVNRGVIALEEADAQSAAELFDEAIRRFRDGPLAAGEASRSDVANAHGWRADALAEAGDVDAAIDARRAEAALYEAHLAERPNDRMARVRLLHANSEAANLLASLGEVSEAETLLDAQIDTASALVAEDEANARFRRLFMAMLRDRAKLALWRGDLVRAQLLLGEADRVRTLRDEAGADDGRHRERMLFHLLAAEIALAAGVEDEAALSAAQAILAGEQAMAAGFESVRPLIAEAYYLHGEALRAAGAPEDARSAYRAARDHLAAAGGPRGHEQTDLMARVRWRLGEAQAAASLRAQLSAEGYARPGFTEFWRDIDVATAGLAAGEGADDDG